VVEAGTGAGRMFSTRQALLALSMLLEAGVFVYRAMSGPSARSGAPTPRQGRASAGSEIPRIGLDRLASAVPPAKAGRRDLFSVGEGQPDDEEAGDDEEGGKGPRGGKAPPPPPVPVATPNPQVAPPVTPRLVAINLKYVGSLEAAGGLKVAVLLTDRNEILYGQVGQQVANRFKILRIGLESVEVLDEGSGQNRRIPFKGN